MKNDIKLYILETGTMEADLAWMLLKPGRVIKDRDHKSEKRAWVQVPTHAVLIEHPEGRILWDTGVPRNWEQNWGPTGLDKFFPVLEHPAAATGFLDSSLAQLELNPEDIDLLVLSHLHFDHAANARVFNNGKTRVVTSQAELDGVATITGYNQGAHIVSDFQGLDIGGVAGDEEIVPGVSVLQTPGHSWGTMSLMVDLPDEGTKLFTSDAVYLADSWGPPAVSGAAVYDNLAWLKSVEKLRRIAQEKDAEVIFGHDENQKTQMKLAPDGYYS